MEVWRLGTGKRLRLFDRAHNGCVTSLTFSEDSSQVISGSFDQTVRIHGLRSGHLLKEFRGHSSFVNAVAYVHAGMTLPAAACEGGAALLEALPTSPSLISAASTIEAAAEQAIANRSAAGEGAAGVRRQAVSASSDGTVKVWELKSAECLATFRLSNRTVDVAVHTVIPLPPCTSAKIAAAAGVAWSLQRDGVLLLAADHSCTAVVVTLGGRVIRTFSSTSLKKQGTGEDEETGVFGDDSANFGPSDNDPSAPSFITATLSPRGRWAYCAAEDGQVYGFNLAHENGAKQGRILNGIGDGDRVSGDYGAAALVKKPRSRERRCQRHQILGLAHHPHHGLLASHADDGLLKLWR